jgi:hypothetical protein
VLNVPQAELGVKVKWTTPRFVYAPAQGVELHFGFSALPHLRLDCPTGYVHKFIAHRFLYALG